jgi:hypothetical protein
MRDDLERFVASLAIPADRKAVVLAELADHVGCAREVAARDGRDPDAAGRAALGDLEALRRSLEAVEPAFAITRRNAFVRGVIASLLVAFVIDRIGFVMHGMVGAIAALAIAVAFAPPRVLELLRADLRAPSVRGRFHRGAPIGPAIVYGYTVLSGPFLVWISLIVIRAIGGIYEVDVPNSAFALMVTVMAVLFVEMFRARRKAIA